MEFRDAIIRYINKELENIPDKDRLKFCKDCIFSKFYIMDDDTYLDEDSDSDDSQVKTYESKESENECDHKFRVTNLLGEQISSCVYCGEIQSNLSSSETQPKSEPGSVLVGDDVSDKIMNIVQGFTETEKIHSLIRDIVPIWESIKTGRSINIEKLINTYKQYINNDKWNFTSKAHHLGLVYILIYNKYEPVLVNDEQKILKLLLEERYNYGTFRIIEPNKITTKVVEDIYGNFSELYKVPQRQKSFWDIIKNKYNQAFQFDFNIEAAKTKGTGKSVTLKIIQKLYKKPIYSKYKKSVPISQLKSL